MQKGSKNIFIYLLFDEGLHQIGALECWILILDATLHKV